MIKIIIIIIIIIKRDFNFVALFYSFWIPKS